MYQLGVAGDTDLDRLADRLAQIGKKGSRILKHSLNHATFYKGRNKIVIAGVNNDYHYNPLTVGNVVKPFTLLEAIKDNSALASRLEIPPEQRAEFEKILLELGVVMATANDVMESIDEIDVLPDVPVDDWLGKLEQAAANINWFEENCDF